MAKYKLDSPKGTPIDPLSFMNSIPSKPKEPSINLDIQTGLEAITDKPLPDGYSSFGNNKYAQQAVNERLANQQGFLDLTGKFIGRTVAKVGTELLKTPGYLVGVGAGLSNEVFGDGKDSMSLVVDNAWINTFENLDQNLKDLMPVHISQQVQEGNILDKLGSGAWWATQGADGVGFMLSMFLPGAATKALGAGKMAGALAEVAANSKLGKGVRLLSKDLSIASNLTDDFVASSSFVRNADGVAASLMNTVIESASEAAGIYDSTYKELREKVRLGEMSEDEAKSQAGKKASSIFKSNLLLLSVSNTLEQAWIFKAFGDVKPESVISKAMKDGKIDFDKLRSLSKKEWKEVLGDYSKDFGKNLAKEGIFEEGMQTTLEQNANKGKDGVGQAAYDLFSNMFTLSDAFLDNTELHESMVLGGILGGGMGLMSTYQENKNLKYILEGYSKETKPSVLTKVFRKLGGAEPKEGKGLINMLEDNWINSFKSNTESLMTDGKLDDKKVLEALERKEQLLVLHAKYDAAVATNNEMEKNIYGSYLAHEYVKPFLGQSGMEYIFKDHVENQVVPAWKERFEKNWQREATQPEIQEFKKQFSDSGLRVIDAYKEASETNNPERYYRPNVAPEVYAKFRSKYFDLKLQTLLDEASLQETEGLLNGTVADIRGKLSEIEDGLLEHTSGTLEVNQKQKVKEYNLVKKAINEKRKVLSEKYKALFTKEGVKDLYAAYEELESINPVEDIQKENEDLKKDVEKKGEQTQSKKQEIKSEAVKPDESTEGLPESGVTATFTPVVNTKTGKESNVKVNEENDVIDETGTVIPENELLNLEVVDKKTENTQAEVYGHTNDSFESKKADIERRRQEELKSITHEYKDDEHTYSSNTFTLKYTYNDLVGRINAKYDAELAALDKDTVVVSDLQDPITEDTELLTINTPIEESPEAIEKEIREPAKSVNPYVTTGRHVQYEATQTRNGVKYTDVRDENGLPVLGTEAQQRWQKYISEVNNNYVLKVFSMSDNTDKELERQIVNEYSDVQSNEVWASLYTVDGKPVKDGDNYIFTSLYTPSIAFDPYNTRIAAKFLASNPNGASEYSEWYRNIKEDFYSISEVTEGHQVDVVKDGVVQWNSAKDNLPKHGELIIAKTDELEYRGSVISVKPGDVFYKTSNGLYFLRSRLLNKKEVDTVFDYLQRLKGATKLSEVKETTTINGVEQQIGVFYDEQNEPLIKHYIRFGGEGQGSISVVKQDGGFKVKIHLIGDPNPAILEVDNPIVREFLQDKRFNINARLLNTEIEQNGKVISYYDYIMSDVLLTTNYIKQGYPDRLQRNVYLGSKIETVTSVKKKFEFKRKEVEALKVLDVDTLLKEKTLSGEILMYCK